MKKFISNIIVFSLIIFSISLIELFIPITNSTFRVWESLAVKKRLFFIGPFYPNYQVTMEEVGGLAHHTNFAVKKDVTWKTDKLGYRNTEFVENPEIIFIGRSNITGSGLDQNETISSKVQLKSSLSSYNLSPSGFNTFLNYLTNGVINKPKYLIYGCIERFIPSFQPARTYTKGNLLVQKIRQNKYFQLMFIQLDRVLKANSYNYMIARLNGIIGKGIQSKKDKHVFFLEGNNAILPSNDSLIVKHADIITSYSDYCDSIGVKFIFFPIPNKETIYFDYAEIDNQPIYLKKLYIELEKRDVVTINTLDVFNQKRSLNKFTSLYQNDDSHWNSQATELVSEEITKLLN